MKQQVKKKKQLIHFKGLTISLITIAMLLNLVTIGYILYPEKTNEIFVGKPSEFKFEYYANKFSEYPEIQYYVNKCKNSEIKTECVWREVPFTWTYRNTPGLYTPTEFYNLNGSALCRDISVIRKSIFNELDVDSKYISEPNHIYVVTFEKGKMYELNNEWLITKTVDGLDYQKLS
jgi:hypothetical protein